MYIVFVLGTKVWNEIVMVFNVFHHTCEEVKNKEKLEREKFEFEKLWFIYIIFHKI